MGKLHNGPFETEREARAAAHEVVWPEHGWSILTSRRTGSSLSGMRVGRGRTRHVRPADFDWLAGFEDSMCAVVAGLVARAVVSPAPGRAASCST